jgi:hypothetical protein
MKQDQEIGETVARGSETPSQALGAGDRCRVQATDRSGTYRWVDLPSGAADCDPAQSVTVTLGALAAMAERLARLETSLAERPARVAMTTTFDLSASAAVISRIVADQAKQSLTYRRQILGHR